MTFVKNRSLTFIIISVALLFGFVQTSFAAQPTITDVTTTPGTYTSGFCVNWTFQLDQYIDVVSGESGPSIDVQIGDNIVDATLSSYSGPGAGTSSANFSYCVEDSDVDGGGIEVFSPIKLNGSTIQSDPGDEDLILTFTPPDSSGVLINPDHPEVTTLSPLDNASTVSAAPSLVLTFDEVVDVENGNITIHKASNDVTINTIDVTSATVSGSGTSTITIDPLEGLVPNTEYYILIDATSFDDTEGNSYTGISNDTSWTFTTAGLVEVGDRIGFDSNTPEIYEGSTQDIEVTLEESIIVPPGGLAEVEITITSSDTDRVTVSPSVITFIEDEWHHTKIITITAVDESILYPSDDRLVYLSYSVVTDSELYAGFERILPVTITDNDQLTSRRTSSSISYTCKDNTASNYNRFGRHKESLCEYEVTEDEEETPTDTEVIPEPTTKLSESNTCSLEQTLTQNLKAPSRNGTYNSYTNDIVTEAHILQAHLNRLGFNSGPEDGILGPISEGAIKDMQTFLGTDPDGYVGPLTLALINESCGEGGLES